MPHIAGVFENGAAASAAVCRLLDEGFQKEDLSLLVSEKARNSIFSSTKKDESTSVTQGEVSGALFGGGFGALIASLTAIGIVVFPGSGLLVAGPIVAVLSGAGLGAVAGGLSGALISAGFGVAEAHHYEKEIKAGKAVIVIHTTDKMEIAARGALLGITPQPITILSAS